MKCKCCRYRCLRGRNLFVDLLSIIYGTGSWIAMTGLWIELPLLVQRLPEGWKIASRLTLALQVANIGPILYGFLNAWYPRIINERSGTHIQLAIGSLSTLLLIFFWTSTVQIADYEISIALYILSFGLSIVDCTSSVVFLPYMANFKSIYLIPYLAGEGLSGLLPSLVGSAQGIDEQICANETISAPSNGSNVNETISVFVPRINEPRFEPEWFFGFLLGMVILSWMSFCMMDWLPICKKEMIEMPEVRKSTVDGELELEPRRMSGTTANSYGYFIAHSEAGSRDCLSQNAYSGRSRLKYSYLLFLQGWASIATFGIFPAVQTYCLLPFGDRAFHLSVILGGVAYPLSCFVAMFLEIRGTLFLSILSAVATALSGSLMYAAVESPDPPMVGSEFGPPIMVACWVLFVFVFSYVKTMVTAVVGDIRGQRGLFWIGAVTQGGAAIGAILMFILVNVLELFREAVDNSCNNGQLT